jgi:hypothetical protein
MSSRADKVARKGTPMATRFKIRRADIRAELRSMFELYGKEVVALALGLGMPLAGSRMSPTAVLQTIHLNQDAAARWLQEQRDRDNRRDAVRFWGMLVLTLIAAVASSIAAWPIIKG